MYMKLYDYIQLRENGDETTVRDKDYIVEIYFYSNSSPTDDWDFAMIELSKLLTITKIFQNGVEVDFSDLIKLKLDNLKQADLFTDYDIDEIMESLESIMSGNVSETWMMDFVNALKKK